MSRPSQMTFLTFLALIAAACTQAGNNGPGGLPASGSYTSGLPGTSSCVATANCAIVPDPYGAPKVPAKDTKPTISTPDYKDGIIPATTGFSASFLIKTTNTSKVTSDCTPAQNATITANTSDGSSLVFFISKMQDKDVSCTLTATGSDGTATLAVTLKAQAAVPGAVKPTIVGLPVDTIKIKHGDTYSLAGISVANQDADAKPLVVSCGYNTPKLVKAADGTYTFSFVNALSPKTDPVDLCTFLTVNGDGSYSSIIMDFMSLAADFKIIPNNFAPAVPVQLTEKTYGTNYIAFTDDKQSVFPQFAIINQDNTDMKNPTISCTGVDYINSAPATSAAQPTLYEVNIQYKPTTKSTAETCTITVENDASSSNPMQTKLTFPIQIVPPAAPVFDFNFDSSLGYGVTPGTQPSGSNFKVSNIDSLAYTCVPDVLDIHKYTSTAGIYRVDFTKPMPNQNVVCDLTATGAGGTTNATLTIHK